MLDVWVRYGGNAQEAPIAACTMGNMQCFLSLQSSGASTGMLLIELRKRYTGVFQVLRIYRDAIHAAALVAALDSASPRLRANRALTSVTYCSASNRGIK